MADLLDRIVIEVEQEERGWKDDATRVFVAEIVQIIADRLARRDTPESEMLWVLDGVPMSVVFEAADRLRVVVWRGVWRRRA